MLVALILGGVLTEDEDATKWIFFGLGALVFVVVLLYSIYDFNWLGGYIGVDWVPWIVLGLLVVGMIVWMAIESKKGTPTPHS